MRVCCVMLMLLGGLLTASQAEAQDNIVVLYQRLYWDPNTTQLWLVTPDGFMGSKYGSPLSDRQKLLLDRYREGSLGGVIYANEQLGDWDVIVNDSVAANAAIYEIRLTCVDPLWKGCYDPAGTVPEPEHGPRTTYTYKENKFPCLGGLRKGYAATSSPSPRCFNADGTPAGGGTGTVLEKELLGRVSGSVLPSPLDGQPLWKGCLDPMTAATMINKAGTSLWCWRYKSSLNGSPCNDPNNYSGWIVDNGQDRDPRNDLPCLWIIGTGADAQPVRPCD